MTVEDPHLLRPGDAPTPFTAAEIREGCPKGRTITTRHETPGEPDVVEVSRFVESDHQGAVIESRGERYHVGWADLQAHASFPAESTTIEDDTIEIPIGRLRCKRYRVASNGKVTTFWFAVDLPGMPVRYVSEKEGEVVSTATVTANEIVAGDG